MLVVTVKGKKKKKLLSQLSSVDIIRLDVSLMVTWIELFFRWKKERNGYETTSSRNSSLDVSPMVTKKNLCRHIYCIRNLEILNVD